MDNSNAVAQASRRDHSDEHLIADTRAGLTPVDMVDRKLAGLRERAGRASIAGPTHEGPGAK